MCQASNTNGLRVNGTELVLEAGQPVEGCRPECTVKLILRLLTAVRILTTEVGGENTVALVILNSWKETAVEPEFRVSGISPESDITVFPGSSLS